METWICLVFNVKKPVGFWGFAVLKPMSLPYNKPWRLHWGNCQHHETNRANSLLVFHPNQPPSRNVLARFPIKIQQKSTKESKGVEGSPYALWIPFHVNSTDENIKSEPQLAATIYSMMLMLLSTVLMRNKMLFHGVLQGLQRIIWWMMHLHCLVRCWEVKQSQHRQP